VEPSSGPDRLAGARLIAAVVPALDEAARIGATVDALRHAGIVEIVVADGGSRDDTAARARDRGARVIDAPRGRARQLNAGAAATSAPLLVFVHADALVPPDAAAWIVDILGRPGVSGGAFRTYTLHDGAGPPSRLAPWLRLADVRARLGRVAYGDQAIFVRREIFDELGGFPDQPLMEDVELSRRLRRRGVMPIVPRDVLVSGRRFVAHPLWATLCCHTFPLLYDLGVSPARLIKLWTAIR
jgi:rSAM/selenodomain-associated transferase 2